MNGELSRSCTCPDDDGTKCIMGSVYTPCESPYCYGVCEYSGYCTCPLHTWPNGPGRGDDDTHESPSMMAVR